MAKINVLPKSVAELIAAGEVVEKPASVVKELIENSIDAGATAITVEIKNGGIRYIRVTDNGCGISREDVPLAFISHATSKIATGADLDAIMTLGFRGEALPSIAAVSRLSLLTKTAEENTGTSFTIEGGEAGECVDAGCPDGTTFTVRDLFFNTPARMKFLKKDATEGIYVSDVVTKAAVAHPEIRFSLIRDGRQTISSPGNGELYDTVYSVLGKEIADSLIKCEYERDNISVTGFISKPLNNRPNRNYQYFYVNKRYVRIPVAAVALDEGYKNSIMVGKFPMCFLNITIPAGTVDVNVHPAKTEVRFSDERAIFDVIYYAAKNALSKGDTARPSVTLREKTPVQKKDDFFRQQSAVQYRFDMNSRSAAAAQKPAETQKPAEAETKKQENSHNAFIHEGAVFRDTSSLFPGAFSQNGRKVDLDIVCDEDEKKDNNPASKAETDKSAVTTPTPSSGAGFSDFVNEIIKVKPQPPCDEDKAAPEKQTKTEILPSGAGDINIVTDDVKQDTARILGEIFKTYILVERGDRLLIIDKHAAHERMIFNSLSKNAGQNGSQMLMFPVTVNLPAKDYVAVLDNLELFGKAGFLVEDFGDNCVVVREVPVELCDSDIRDIVIEMAGKLASGNVRPSPEKLEWIYDSTACRAAIKAGSIMKELELETFVKTVLSDDSIKYCPHGRPVLFELSKHEIEKQFGRLG